MTQTMSACGVLCSSCPAFNASLKGVAHQNRTAAAWRRIYRLKEPAENISCGGCQAPEDQLFHTSRGLHHVRGMLGEVVCTAGEGAGGLGWRAEAREEVVTSRIYKVCQTILWAS